MSDSALGDQSQSGHEPKRILVTGASGFIGTHLVPALCRDHKVTTFGRSNAPARQFRSLDLRHKVGDVTNYEQVREAVKDQDVVFHMAGLVSYKDADLARLHAVNVEGTRNVMRACFENGVRRVVHTSSVAAFGVPPLGTEGNESIEYNLGGMDLHYCDTKHEGELVVREYFERGLNVVILNPGIIFGEGDTHPHHFAIFRSMSKGYMFCVPPGGTPYSDINDVVAAHLAALDHGAAGERYSLVSANLTYMDAARVFSRIYKCSPPRVVLPSGLVLFIGQMSEFPLFRHKSAVTWQTAFLSVHKIFFDCKKAAAELNFKPTPFEETVKRTSSYYLK